VLYVVLTRALNYWTFLPTTSVYAISTLIFLVLLLIWGYNYWDWRDDKYQVTPDQIIDIDRKPLGKEEKRAAPLENILSLEHSRPGFIPMAFNFGDVSISIGGSKFVFEGVSNPALVQQDIFSKMNSRKEKKAASDKARENKKMALWFEAYGEAMQTVDQKHPK